MNRKDKSYKIVIDTNIWISFLIGKHLSRILDYILDERIVVCTCAEQLQELWETFRKPKLQKYFDNHKIAEFFEFLAEYAQTVRLITETDICRDKKDNFLLSLAFDADADYLVTGDNDLLVLLEIKNAKIVTFRFFEQIMMNYI